MPLTQWYLPPRSTRRSRNAPTCPALDAGLGDAQKNGLATSGTSLEEENIDSIIDHFFERVLVGRCHGVTVFW